MSIPSLRERTEDIPLLAFRFAMRTAEDTGKRLDGIAPETLSVLQRYPWPGNVRELQHVIERAVILSPDPMLPPHALEAERFGLTHASAVAGAIDGPSPLRALAAGFGRLGMRAASGMTHAFPDDGDEVDDPMRVVLHSLDVNEAEKVLITRALEVAQQNRTRAADLLGMSVRTLRNKLNGPGAA
jgi:DNA-binding NtrC family response regulator